MKLVIRSFVVSATLISALNVTAPSRSYANNELTASEADSETALEQAHIEIARRLLTEAKYGSTVQIVSRLSRLDPNLVRHYFQYDLSNDTKLDLYNLMKSQMEMRDQIRAQTSLLLVQAGLPVTKEAGKEIVDQARSVLVSNRAHLKEIEANLNLIGEVLNNQHVDHKRNRLTDDVVRKLRAIEIVEVIPVSDMALITKILDQITEIDSSVNQAVSEVRIFPPRVKAASGPVVIDLATSNPRLRFSLEIPKPGGTCEDRFKPSH